MKIDIISREMIKPSTPTPSNLRNFKMSMLDQITPPMCIPLILFYSCSDEIDRYNRSSSSSSSHELDIYSHLRRSLSDALSRFYPLAGRIKGESYIDCNDEGVVYIEARVDGQLCDIIERSWRPPATEMEEEEEEDELINNLIPYNLFDRESNPNIVLEVEQIGIKVSLFNCGGIAIGICISHKIADAYTLITFIKGWAAIARGRGDDINNLVSPCFVSASLFPPKEPLGFDLLVPAPVPEEGLVTRTFLFSASTISALKGEVIKHLPTSSSSSVKPPTRVEVVSAVIWKCAIGSTGVGKRRRRSLVFHQVNLRGRAVPPLPENSFGNLIQSARAVLDEEEEEEPELAQLVAKLKCAFERIDCDYIGSRMGKDGNEVIRGHIKEIGKLLSKEEVQILKFSSWCGFSIYESDFGWGKPSWVSFASFYVKNAVFLMDSRWAGGIEVWVTMSYQDMETFQHQFQSFISPFESS